MKKPHLCIVTPALADANNGNWQTARRWARCLAPHYVVHLSRQWPDPALAGLPLAGLLALHARRSADSVAAWAQAYPDRPLVVALTGTDLYRDIRHDASAQRSLELAWRLVALQDQGPLALPEAHRAKCVVAFQSTGQRRALPRTGAHLRAVMVGHLRDEKRPQTLFAAARLLAPDEGILIDHLGQALDPALGLLAEDTARACPHYRWLGGVAHGAARGRIQRAHLLVHSSLMEGGAHVVMEAVCSSTPVLASRMDGNLGMLGADYGGYFEVDDAPGLVTLLRRCRAEQAQPEGLLARLQHQCAKRAPLFAPAAEQAALLALWRGLL